MTNKNILGFGKDKDSFAKPIGIAGEKNNKLITISLEEMVLLQKILKEFKKFNINLETITNTKLEKADIDSYKTKL